MHILIIFGSLEGQTRKIVEHIADILHNKGHQITLLSSDRLSGDFAPDHFDAAIIGAPVHMGKFPRHITSFVTTYRDWLNRTPSAFISVCMAINSVRAESREQAIRYGEDFLAQTGWRPALTRTFAGAVKYTQYNLITRFIMKMISKREGGSTDTTQDHEYTDWNSVTQFTEEFITMISAQKIS